MVVVVGDDVLSRPTRSCLKRWQVVTRNMREIVGGSTVRYYVKRGVRFPNRWQHF